MSEIIQQWEQLHRSLVWHTRSRFFGRSGQAKRLRPFLLRRCLEVRLKLELIRRGKHFWHQRDGHVLSSRVAEMHEFCDTETIKKLGELVNLFEDDPSSPEGAKLKDSEYFYPDAPRSRKVSSGTPYIWEDADAVRRLQAAEREIEELLDSLPLPPPA